MQKQNKNENLLKNITEMKDIGYLSKEQAGIIFTMHVENYMGVLKLSKMSRNLIRISQQEYLVGKLQKWNSYKNEEQFNLYKRETQQKFKSNDIQLIASY